MKRISKSVFFVVALLILVFTVVSIFGVKYYAGDNQQTVIKGITDIRWGIDIRGGVEATFKPADGVEATDEQLDSAKAIIETRLVTNAITDYELYSDYGSDRIIVRFPWKSDDVSQNHTEAINELAATAKLTFKNSSGEELMDGSMVKKAYPSVAQEDGQTSYVVSLEFTNEGATKFKEITTEYINQQVSIYMDDTLLSAPNVKTVIADGKAQISGDFDADSATELANQINGGALPFALEVASSSSVSSTLGSNSLMAMAYAGIIALVLISLFMIIRYRVPGFVAVIALLGQVALSIAAITRFFGVFDSFTMTLPGVAGIILSVGMGVDANIITAERIRDEFKQGKTLDGAIERGTKNSLSAIIDGNMTVVIVSLILLLVFGPSNILSWLFGQSTTGSIYSFGYTLLMGVISNFIMGVLLSRLMLKSIVGFKFLRKKTFFGGAKE